MDFDIGNILYVVITIVAVAVGLLGKKKKKAPGGSAPGESKPGFMENLEKILSQGQEEAVVMDLQDHEQDLEVEEALVEQEEPDWRIKPDDMEPKSEFMEEYEQVLNRLRERDSDMFSSEMEINSEPLEIIYLDEEEGTDYFEIIKDFDAGTAVVYSAIINRTDY